MPESSKILHFALQRGTPTLWAEVDTEKDMIDRDFAYFATGQSQDEHREYDTELRYIGSVLMSEDWYVFHLYEWMLGEETG